ncbi:DUF86 domain-containing protein [bacterium]|nr:DUF86 domain-containing protein [bacterium]
MSRDPLAYVQDIIEACHHIRDYTTEMEFEDFENDPKTYDAVARNLEIIGEAVKFIPLEIKQRNPQIPWQLIVGLRNILAHVYFGIDQEILWSIVTDKLDELEAALRPYVE